MNKRKRYMAFFMAFSLTFSTGLMNVQATIDTPVNETTEESGFQMPSAEDIVTTTLPTSPSTEESGFQMPSTEDVITTTLPTSPSTEESGFQMPSAEDVVTTTLPTSPSTEESGFQMPSAEEIISTILPTSTTGDEFQMPSEDDLLSVVLPTVSDMDFIVDPQGLLYAADAETYTITKGAVYFKNQYTNTITYQTEVIPQKPEADMNTTSGSGVAAPEVSPEIDEDLEKPTTPEMNTTPDTNTTPDASTTPSTGATPDASTTPSTGATPDASTTPNTGATPDASTAPSTSTTPDANTTPDNSTSTDTGSITSPDTGTSTDAGSASAPATADGSVQSLFVKQSNNRYRVKSASIPSTETTASDTGSTTETVPETSVSTSAETNTDTSSGSTTITNTNTSVDTATETNNDTSAGTTTQANTDTSVGATTEINTNTSAGTSTETNTGTSTDTENGTTTDATNGTTQELPSTEGITPVPGAPADGDGTLTTGVMTEKIEVDISETYPTSANDFFYSETSDVIQIANTSNYNLAIRCEIHVKKPSSVVLVDDAETAINYPIASGPALFIGIVTTNDYDTPLDSDTSYDSEMYPAYPMYDDPASILSDAAITTTQAISTLPVPMVTTSTYSSHDNLYYTYEILCSPEFETTSFALTARCGGDWSNIKDMTSDDLSCSIVWDITNTGEISMDESDITPLASNTASPFLIKKIFDIWMNEDTTKGCCFS